LVRAIYINPSITADEKRQLIDQVYYSMIELARHGNAAPDRADAGLK